MHHQDSIPYSSEAYKIKLENKPVFFIEDLTETPSKSPLDRAKEYYEELKIASGDADGQSFESKKFVFVLFKGGNHWTICKKNSNEQNFTEIEIADDGYCGITSAIVAANELVDPSPQIYTNSIIDSSSGKKQLKRGGEDFLVDSQVQNDILSSFNDASDPNNELQKNKVRNLFENKGKSEYWADNEVIKTLVKNIAGAENFCTINSLTIAQQSLGVDDRNKQIDFQNFLLNPPSDLQSSYDLSKIIPESKSHKHLMIFYQGLDEESLKRFLISKEKIDINIYTIYRQFEVYKKNTNSEVGIDDEIFKNKILQFQQDNSLAKNVDDKLEKLNNSKKFLMKILEADQADFSEVITKYNKFNDDLPFKDKIEPLFEEFKNKFGANKADLIAYRKSILPDQCKPDSNYYLGWNEEIKVVKNNGKIKLFYRDNEIKSIFKNGDDKMDEILSNGDQYLISCAVVDLFRNSKHDISIKFTDSKIADKEFLIQERKVVKDGKIIDSETAEIEYKDSQAKSASKIRERLRSTMLSSPFSPGPELKEILKHVEKRFKTLENIMENEPDSIIVFPGKLNDDDDFNHFLGTGLARGQWGNKQEDREFLVAKIKENIQNLRRGREDRVIFGRVGDICGDQDKFIPQFPFGNEGWDNFEQRIAIDIFDDQSKKELIISYESILKIKPKTDLGQVGIDLNEKIKDLIKEYKNKFKDKNFIHVWGANANNWNLENGEVLSNWGGQATSISCQKEGSFPIVTTPVSGIKGLVDTCKTYGKFEEPSTKTANCSLITNCLKAR